MIRRTRGIPQQSEKRKETRRAWEQVAEAALRRDRYTCQAGPLVTDLACKGRLDPHHVLPRGRGGADELGNLVTLCRAHHDWAHAYPSQAAALGLLDRGA